MPTSCPLLHVALQVPKTAGGKKKNKVGAGETTQQEGWQDSALHSQMQHMPAGLQATQVRCT